MDYYSQYGQDKYIHETFFLNFHGGTFVEFGALDGVLDSNTLFFEKEQHWTGILIEPNPEAFALLVQNRPHCKNENVAISSEASVMQFKKIRGGFYGWSGLLSDMEPQHLERINQHIPQADQETINVNVRTLAWLADRHQLHHVDLMSIDTEGTEEKIMQSFPWDRLTVSVFCIENNFRNYDSDALMASHGYTKGSRIGSDDIYYKQALIR
jgi:FkbM family methyltransferase